MCIGYNSLHKGYKRLNKSTGQVYISHDVVFDEITFPFASSDNAHNTIFHHDSILPPVTVMSSTTHPPVPSSPMHDHVNNSNLPTIAPTNLAGPGPSNITSSTSSSETEPQPSVCTRVRNNIRQPKQYTDDTVRYPLKGRACAAVTESVSEPSSHIEVAQHVEWRRAMDAEFDALQKKQYLAFDSSVVWTKCH